MGNRCPGRIAGASRRALVRRPRSRRARRCDRTPARTGRRCARRPTCPGRGVAGPELEAHVVALVDHGGLLDDLEVVGVQAIGQPQEGRQAPHGRPVVVVQGHVLGMPVGRERPAVVAGDVGDQVALAGGEAVQVGVADQVQRVLVVGRLAHREADVVEQPGHLEQPPLGRPEAVQGTGLVEQRQGQGGHLASVGLVPGVPAGEVEHRPAAPRVVRRRRRRPGVAAGQLGDDHPFAQRPRRQHQLAETEGLHDQGGHLGPGHDVASPGAHPVRPGGCAGGRWWRPGSRRPRPAPPGSAPERSARRRRRSRRRVAA